MMTLKVPLLESERPSDGSPVAFVFRLEDGVLIVSEQWPWADQVYSTTVTVHIPLRVWRLVNDWLEQLGVGLNEHEWSGDYELALGAGV